MIVNNRSPRTSDSAPDAPVLYSIFPATNNRGEIPLNWTDVPDITGYDVYRNTSTVVITVGLIPIVTDLTMSNYTDTKAENGTYYYVVVAKNASGISPISNCESVEVSIPAFTDGYALIVGINDYPGYSNDLTYCIPDVNGVETMLLGYGFNPNNIVKLTNSMATQANINTQIDQIALDMDDDDLFVFYYSGHGNFEAKSTTTHSISISTPHYYPNYYDNYWTINHPGALAIRVKFSNFNTESGYDFGYVCDTDFYGCEYSGSLGNFWSDWILGDVIYVGLWSDNIYTRYGFDVYEYEVMTEVNGSLVTYDFSSSDGIWGQELDGYLDSIPGGAQYVFLDSCMSGALISDLTQSGRAVMTACAPNEYSMESPDLGHGIFTNFLLGVFEMTGNQYNLDINVDGTVDVEEMFDYIEPHAIAESASMGYVQHPQLENNVVGSGSWNLDPDFDGMPSWWEYINYLDPYDDADNETDLDGDGLSNLDEYLANSSAYLGDTDGDQIYDLEETIPGVDGFITDPSNADTDGDGLDDFEEVGLGLDPSNPDTDGDDLADMFEFSLSTDPTDADTDGDGLQDGWEYEHGLDPTVPDQDGDTDGDGLSNFTELDLGTDPGDSDSDNDGMPDGWEVSNSLNPLYYWDRSRDDDGDELTNYYEFLNGGNPWNNDTDGDGLDDYDELYKYNTELGNPDTDGDGMADGWEVLYKLNPKNPADSSSDSDHDGLTNLEEYKAGTNPKLRDTDGDGYSDSAEIDAGTDPTDRRDNPGTSKSSSNSYDSYDPDSITGFFVVLGLLFLFVGIPVMKAQANKKSKLRRPNYNALKSYSQSIRTQQKSQPTYRVPRNYSQTYHQEVPGSQLRRNQSFEKLRQGIYLESVGRDIEAAEAFRQAVIIDPSYMPAQFALVAIFEKIQSQQARTTLPEPFEKEHSCAVCGNVGSSHLYECPHCGKRFCVRHHEPFQHECPFFFENSPENDEKSPQGERIIPQEILWEPNPGNTEDLEEFLASDSSEDPFGEQYGNIVQDQPNVLVKITPPDTGSPEPSPSRESLDSTADSLFALLQQSRNSFTNALDEKTPEQTENLDQDE